MRSVEDKGCNDHGPIIPQEMISCNGGFEFHKGNGVGRVSHHRASLGKPTPSKWDDAQKWLVGLSRGGGGDKSHSKTKPRNSNADDLRLIAPVPRKEQDYSSSEQEDDDDEEEEGDGYRPSFESGARTQSQVETKKVDCDQSIWRLNKSSENSSCGIVRSICVRDMGTEMTPIASQDPSRTATPIRATTPAVRSPISSGSSTPLRGQNGLPAPAETNLNGRSNIGATSQSGEEPKAYKIEEKNKDQAKKLSPLEKRAMAWDEAERAKYMARFKREEVKIQAWENHEKRKAETEVRKMEVKAERMKARAQEKLANKLAATGRIAEERRASAEAKLNEKALKTSERADYIRRTGHVPSSFSFKLPSLCW